MDTFTLHLINNRAESTTREDTIIDGVFSRSMEKIISQKHVSYFSYRKQV